MKVFNIKYSFSFFQIFLLFFFVFMLISPQKVFLGGCKGLVLWYKTVLPTLFPFMVISNLLINSEAILLIANKIAPFIRYLFHTSGAGAFAVIIGFLCGYPMGSKTIADLYTKNLISRQEASYLLSFCNNCSPAFIISYFCIQLFKKTSLIIPSLIILLGTPMLMSVFFRHKYRLNTSSLNHSFASADFGQTDIKISTGSVIDDSFSNAIENILKIAGYIVMFCIIVELCTIDMIQNSFLFQTIMVPGLEITNGLTALKNSNYSLEIKYIMSIFCMSHGGLCSIAQTMSMISNTNLSIIVYTKEKLATSIVASLFAILYIFLF